jgi:hypothetical protein
MRHNNSAIIDEKQKLCNKAILNAIEDYLVQIDSKKLN